jgi:pyridoxal phosphate enzyme (YggS family)
MQNVAQRLKSVQAIVAQSILEANRPSNTVKLLAVSKTKPVSDIVLAYEAGQRLFGENYVQEGVDKIHTLARFTDIEWHFIGPLQSNKTRLVAENFDWVQGLDRLKIAQRLNDQRGKMTPLNLCIQVNIDDDDNKAGLEVSQLLDFAGQISAMPNLRLRGLMTILKANQPAGEQVHSYTKMASLFKGLQDQYSSVDTLSMGMSGDMKNAISCGSSMVRVGTAIFGSRN